MTESDMQNIVVHLVRQPADLAIVPNVHCLGHESDVLRLTKTRRLYEYEVKLTRADFLRDRKKWIKGLLLADLDKEDGHYRATQSTPNQFWYAVLDGVATVDDVPKRAGLIVVDPVSHHARVERRASSIHDEPAHDRVIAYLSRGMTIRYWQERDGINPGREARQALLERIREANQRQREDQRQRKEQNRKWLAERGAGHS